MSKFAKLLKMVKILEEAEEIISTKELSQKLGVSERMVRKYINDIKEAELPIKSKSGPTGGIYFEKEKN